MLRKLSKRTLRPKIQWHDLYMDDNGDLNPGLFLFLVYSFLGIGLVIVCCAAVIIDVVAWPALLGAMTFVLMAMLVMGIWVLPVAKGKLLAPALQSGAGSIASAGRSTVLQGMGSFLVDDERY